MGSSEDERPDWAIYCFFEILMEFAIDQRKRLRELEEEQLYRLKFEKYRFYTPNGKCAEYIKAIGSGDNFIIFFSAANGVGKTASSANVVAHIIWGQESANPYFNYPVFKHWKFPKRGRIISDPKNLESTIIPALNEWLPNQRYKSNKSGKHYDSFLTMDNGWEVDLMSFEQDPKEFEGSTLGFAWFDEIPPEIIFKATVARMRKGGIIFISATPLSGSGWMFDAFVSKGKTADGTDIGRSSEGIAHIEADVEAACKQHGIRGHLEHSNIEKMIALYSEDEKWARIQGKFAHLIGLRFKQFRRNIHVIRPFEMKLEDYTVYEALDPHPRTNDAVIWIAVDRKGTKFIIDELWCKCQGGTKELAQRIKNKATQYRLERRIIDPSASIEDQHTQQSLQANLSREGLVYFEASKMRTQSDRRIEDALTYQEINLLDQKEFIKAPELYIFDTCQRTIYEFEHYRWDEWSGKTGENKDKKEATIDKDDHFIENIGRILIMEPKFIEMPAYRNMPAPEPSYDPYT